jgi:hypothetical protein
MAIIVHFTPPSMTAQQYDQIIERLAVAGQGAPADRRYHVCFGSGDRMQVIDVWESPESFERFGQTLMPILQQLEIDPGQPDVQPVQSIITG